MSDGKPDVFEASTRPDFRVRIFNIPRDPYHYNNCLYTTLNTLGYPISFEKPESPGFNPHEHVQIATDSEESRDKLGKINTLLYQTSGYRLIRQISEGETYWIELLLDGREKEYYDSYLTGEKGKIPEDKRQQFDRETLEACFVKSQEREQARNINPLDLNRERTERARMLREGGVRPIEIERMAFQLLKPAIEGIIKEHPELAPPPLQPVRTR